MPLENRTRIAYPTRKGVGMIDRNLQVLWSKSIADLDDLLVRPASDAGPKLNQ
jgi:hypothetical protein